MRQALDIALITAVVCGIVISAGMWVGSDLLAGIFLDSSEPAYNYATAGLPLLGLCALPFALNITFIGYYQSCERSTRSIIYMMLRGIIFMVPGFILLPVVAGVPAGLWLAIPLSELLTLLIIAIAYILARR